MERDLDTILLKEATYKQDEIQIKEGCSKVYQCEALKKENAG